MRTGMSSEPERERGEIEARKWFLLFRFVKMNSEKFRFTRK